jgi:iron complex outermembrane receptor protein
MTDRYRNPRASKCYPYARLSQCISAILAGAASLHALPANADAMDEIVVTATRRSVSVSDIPYNISAISAADIANSGVTDLQGLTRMIPGLVGPDLGPRASSMNGTFTIRGLNASSVNTQDRSSPRMWTRHRSSPTSR